jgi:thioredoxin 1
MPDTNSNTIVNSTSADFEKDVIQSQVPVLVDFWAEWCTPCKMIAPTLEKLSKELDGKLKIVKIDIDANPDIAQKYMILSIPNLKVFNQGQVVMGGEITGAWPEPQMKAKVNQILESIGTN